MILLAAALLTVCVQASPLGIVGKDVLLPCACSLSTNYLVWQIEEDIVNYYTESSETSLIDRRFHNRTQLYLPAEKANCSLLLLQVSVADENTYTCYTKKTTLKREDIILKVAANYSIRAWKGLNVSEEYSRLEEFHCEARDGYPLGRIYWLLQGQAAVSSSGPQRNSSGYNGLYTVSSNVTINSTGSYTLQCVIENLSLQVNITSSPLKHNKPIQFIEVRTPSRAQHYLPAGIGVFIVLSILTAVVWKVGGRRSAPSTCLHNIWEHAGTPGEAVFVSGVKEVGD